MSQIHASPYSSFYRIQLELLLEEWSKIINAIATGSIATEKPYLQKPNQNKRKTILSKRPKSFLCIKTKIPMPCFGGNDSTLS